MFPYSVAQQGVASLHAVEMPSTIKKIALIFDSCHQSYLSLDLTCFLVCKLSTAVKSVIGDLVYLER